MDNTTGSPNKIMYGLLAVMILMVSSCITGAFAVTPDARRTLINAVFAVASAVSIGVIGFSVWYATEQVLIVRARRRAEQNKPEFNVYETQAGDLHTRVYRPTAIGWRRVTPRCWPMHNG